MDRIGAFRLLPAISTAAMVLLCMIAVCGGSSFFFYTAAWLSHVALLLLFPKSISDLKTIVLIGLPALLCRVMLVAQFPMAAHCPGATKWVSVFFDLSVLAWIMTLLHSRALPLRWSVLYAFSPVVLYAYAGNGYMDAGFAFFFLGAIFFYDRKRWTRMYLFSGLSIAFNGFAAAAVPFLFRRDNLRCAWVLVLASAASGLVLPYLFDRVKVFYQTPVPRPQVVGSIHAMVNAVSGDPVLSGFALYILLGTALLCGCLYVHPLKNPRHGNDPLSGCFFALGACILFSTDVHFGKLSWIVPFLCFRPLASWMLFSLTIGLTLEPNIGWYLSSSRSASETGAMIAPLWGFLLCWGPFWMLFLNDLYLAWQRKKAPVDCVNPESVSVVIPAVNEAERIGPCIQAAKMHPAVKEVIVVDGGSTDGTIEKANGNGAVALRLGPDRRRGRGGQIHAGVRSSSGDIVVVVHADVRISARIVQDILLLMKRQPMFAGGAVGSVFDSKCFRYRLIEAANDFRMVCLGIGFGDQVQFFRRRPVVAVDLFPEIPLMEDVEFGIRLHRLGRQAFLFGDARVSPRRWEQKGAPHAGIVIRLFAAYMFQRIWKTPDTQAMYRKYYPTQP